MRLLTRISGLRRGGGLLALCRRLLRCRRGVYAVEFGLIAPVFFVLMIAVLETSLFYFKASVLEGAVRDAVRGIKTGQDQGAAGGARSAFSTAVCDGLVGVIDCSSLVISMNAYASFAAAAAAPAPVLFDAAGNPLGQTFNPGTGNQVVVVVVGYIYHFVTPLVAAALSPSHRDTGTVTATSSSVFRNEPF